MGWMVPIDGEVGHLEAVLLEELAGVEHRMMLEHTGDDVLLALGGQLVRHALDRPVIGLRAAGGEEDLLRVGTEALGHAGTGVDDGALVLAPLLVDAGGIAEMLLEIGQHLL